jgi:hypothetical protein
MKAIVENPLKSKFPIIREVYIEILNRITWCRNEGELRDVIRFISMEFPVTFNSYFEYGFGRNHMWVSEKKSGKRLILIEF